MIKNPFNRKKGPWLGFPIQLFLVTILPLTILLLIVAFGSQSLHQEAMRSMVGDRDLRAVRAAASSIELEINHRSSMIEMLARSNGGPASLANLPITAQEITNTFDGGLAILNPAGKLVEASGEETYWPQIPVLFPGYLESVNQKINTPVFSKTIRLEGENKTLVLIGAQRADKNILVGAFSPSFLIGNTLIHSISSEQTSIMVIASGKSGGIFDVLYHIGPVHADESLNSHPGIEDSLNGDSGINYYPVGGAEHVVAFSPIAPLGWGLVTEEAWEDIATPYLNTTQAAPLVIIPLFLLALLALWFGVRRIVQPLQALEKQAEDLAKGDFNSIHQPVGGIAEIRNLQSELVVMADQLKGAQQSLHHYIGAITAGIENERRSLARDLHDDTIQSLIVLNQHIQAALRAANPSDAPQLKELQGLVQEAMVNLRRLIGGLRPIYLEDLGLVSSLKVLVQESEQKAGLPISFQMDGIEQRFESQVEVMLYRMVQEGLSNVVKHAEAHQAWVTLNFSTKGLSLEIKDDGKGFSPPFQPSEFAPKGHFGLLGLHERAELIHADLNIISPPGEGTILSIFLPIQSGTNGA